MVKAPFPYFGGKLKAAELIKCHDADCPQRTACPHYLADLSVTRHVASGRSGGSCDLWEPPHEREGIEYIC